MSIVHQLSFEDFFLPFDGKLSGDTRSIKLAELIQWDVLEYDYAAQLFKDLRAPTKPFRMHWARQSSRLVSSSWMKNWSSESR